jgi:protein-tyrosine phosphatase
MIHKALDGNREPSGSAAAVVTLPSSVASLSSRIARPFPLPSPRSTGKRQLGRLFVSALFTSAVLCAYFVFVYTLGLNVAAMHAHVPTIAFAWERFIPFVPWMIIPYFSVDLFFAAAPLLCADRRELKTVATRIALAITIAGAIFMVFPLRLSLERPEVGGVPGMLFGLLNSFDRPFNLAPSLHITLRSILWIVYVRRTRGILRPAVKVWFVLIGLSTLLTWQHHVFDLVTGQMLAMAIIYAVPENSAALRRARRMNSNCRSFQPPREGSARAGIGCEGNTRTRFGIRYAIGSLACVAAAFAWTPWSIVMLWPAVSLGIVAAGYVRFGAVVFRKSQNGRLDAATRVVLGPFLLGAWAAQWWHRRRTPGWSRVSPGLIVGAKPTRDECCALATEGVTAVLDLTAEFARTRSVHAVAYANVPILDLTLPTPGQLDECVRFIARRVSDGSTVFVHCGLGRWRSAIIATAYLLASGRAKDAEEAAEIVQAGRAGVVIDASCIVALRALESPSIRPHDNRNPNGREHQMKRELKRALISHVSRSIILITVT